MKKSFIVAICVVVAPLNLVTWTLQEALAALPPSTVHIVLTPFQAESHGFTHFTNSVLDRAAAEKIRRPISFVVGFGIYVVGTAAVAYSVYKYYPKLLAEGVSRYNRWAGTPPAYELSGTWEEMTLDGSSAGKFYAGFHFIMATLSGSAIPLIIHSSIISPFIKNYIYKHKSIDDEKLTRAAADIRGNMDAACIAQGAYAAVPVDEIKIRALPANQLVKAKVYLNGEQLSVEEILDLDISDRKIFYILEDFECQTQRFFPRYISINKLIMSNTISR